MLLFVHLSHPSSLCSLTQFRILGHWLFDNLLGDIIGLRRSSISVLGCFVVCGSDSYWAARLGTCQNSGAAGLWSVWNLGLQSLAFSVSVGFGFGSALFFIRSMLWRAKQRVDSFPRLLYRTPNYGLDCFM